jgi:hypothetical protein
MATALPIPEDYSEITQILQFFLDLTTSKLSPADISTRFQKCVDDLHDSISPLLADATTGLLVKCASLLIPHKPDILDAFVNSATESSLLIESTTILIYHLASDFPSRPCFSYFLCRLWDEIDKNVDRFAMPDCDSFSVFGFPFTRLAVLNLLQWTFLSLDRDVDRMRPYFPLLSSNPKLISYSFLRRRFCSP